jgi:hypothetical protein
MKRPIPRKNINLDGLISECESYLDFIESDDFHEDIMNKYENSIYEFVINSLYGDEFFDLLNDKM